MVCRKEQRQGEPLGPHRVRIRKWKGRDVVISKKAKNKQSKHLVFNC